MQSFELLGGKYQQGEQILPGVIQTFRSYEVPTGRPVFIHRIAANDPAAKEIADLLSAGLIRSPVVRKMLLDVYESEPYRFVVTEPARECVPLRDWLEREADEAPELAPQPAPPPPASESPLCVAPAAETAPPPEPGRRDEAEAIEPAPEAEASEFARLFHEALSGKLERSRRNAAQQNAVPPKPANGKPPVEQKPEEPRLAVRAPAQAPVTLVPRQQSSPPLEPAPAAEPLPAPEPNLFQVVEAERAGRSTLIIFLVVLAVLAVLLAMFVLVFVTR